MAKSPSAAKKGTSPKKLTGRPGEELIRSVKAFAPLFRTKGLFDSSDLATHQLGNPIVLRGLEAFRLRRVVTLIQEQLSGQSSAGYFPEDLSTPGVLEDLRGETLGGSLFSKSRVVAIYEADSIRQSLGEKLLPLFSPPRSNLLFVLVCSLKGQLPKWLQESSEKGVLYDIQNLQGSILQKWMKNELERLGHRGGIAPEALDILLRSFGEDTSRLASEIAKLALFVGENEVITASQIQLLCLASKETNTFELLEACAVGDALRAFRILDALSAQGDHPLQILALLSKCVRSLLANTDRGGKPLHSDISNQWILKNIPQSQRKFTRPTLEGALTQLAHLDLGLKGSKREGTELLRDFLVSLSTRSTAITHPLTGG